MRNKYDFSGWATKNNLKCSDGLVIRNGAFKENNGKTVPLIWNHKHDDPDMILGHAMLENRREGVYAYCTFNNNPKAKAVKESLKHGDIVSLSIWANNLVKDGADVIHGAIREVSLVLAGANPGAFIESVMAHGMSIDEDEDEAIIYTGDGILLPGSVETNISHADETGDEPESQKKKKNTEDDDSDDETIADIYDDMTDKQKQAVAVIVGMALEDNESEEDDEMGHNLFENNQNENAWPTFLSHSDCEVILEDAKKFGSLKEALKYHREEEDGLLSHGEQINTTGMTVATGTSLYGFNDPNMLFPDFKNVNNGAPEWISRNMDWVNVVMTDVSRTPFSRIKSVFANITEDEARARGYIKGKQKKEEVFTTLKRTTSPQTIYKKQKLDRDDIVDITDFDVVAWIRAEMRMMLNEEIARAILVGDGRPSDSDDKIQEQHVRPVATDVPLFNIKKLVSVSASATTDEIAKEIVRSAIKGRKAYKGSGTPKFYTTESVLTDLLLLEDGIGHRLYKTEEELSTALRVSKIVTVEVMEGLKVDEKELLGVIVNLSDYKLGADKGGEINNFEDFDIDYNQHKYLTETRVSGALVKPFSAITLLLDKTGVSAASIPVRSAKEV